MNDMIERRTKGSDCFCQTMGQSMGGMDVAGCDGIPSPAAKSNVAGTRGERLHSIGKYESEIRIHD